MIMETWQIILAIFIVILSIVLPIYYSRKKKSEDKRKESEALERMQIREYGRQINEETRAKRK
jgi:preprotein translocase subunit SecG